MLFTPDERRALLALIGLLSLGLLAWVAFPDAPSPACGGDSLLVLLAQEAESLATSSAPPGSAAGTSLAPAPPGLAGEGRIRINEADEAALEALPRIGPALAGRIVASRREGGPFRAPADLRRVKGIGPRTVERLAPLLSFEIAPGDSPSFADSSMQIARGARGRPAASGSQPRASSRLP